MKLEKGQYKTGDIIKYQPVTEDEEGEYIVIDPVRDTNASHDDRKIIGYWLVKNSVKVRSFLKDGNFSQEFTKDDSKLTKDEKYHNYLKILLVIDIGIIIQALITNHQHHQDHQHHQEHQHHQDHQTTKTR